MTDQPTKGHRSLSEISHLFLSSVRERATGSAAMPRRRPPVAASAPSIDLTPEEYRGVMGEQQGVAAAAAVAVEQASDDGGRPEGTAVPPVKALIVSHLGERQLECARRYGRSLAASGKRVGLIVVDASEFRLFAFDTTTAAGGTEGCGTVESGVFDVRGMTEAVNELCCDVDCWLLAVGNTRLPEARSLLRDVESWVVISTCDQEGIVACYRSLKGLADLNKERVSLATLDAKEPSEAEGVFRKLSGVCGQFLRCAIEPEPVVGEARHVAEVAVMNCQAAGDKAQLAQAKHWQVVADLLARAKQGAGGAPAAATRVPGSAQVVEQAAAAAAAVPVGNETPVQEQQIQQEQLRQQQQQETHVQHEQGEVMNQRKNGTGASMRVAPMPEVIDLPSVGDETSLLSAVMRHVMNELIECPLRAPACPEARLAVSRERRIILVAVARHGLGDLKAIGLAYRWVVENRSLMAMALPQFALDAHQLPHLRLLVDQADLDADVLQPIFQAENVSVHTYRHVRWGARMGLLLDAA